MCFLICSVVSLEQTLLSVYGVFVKEFVAFLLTVDAAEESFDLNLARQLHDTVNHCFGTRGTSGDEYVHGNDFFDAFGYMVAFAERAAGDGAATAGYDVFGLGQLVVEAAEYGDHTVDDRSGHHHKVGLTR